MRSIRTFARQVPLGRIEPALEQRRLFVENPALRLRASGAEPEMVAAWRASAANGVDLAERLAE